MDYFQTKTNPNSFSIDRGNTIRYPSNVLFAVNAADRFQKPGANGGYDIAASRSATGTSPFDFVINKRENMLAGSFTRLGLTEFVMPYNIPNINDATNKIIVSAVNAQTGSTIQSTLMSTFAYVQGQGDIGFFDGNALASRLQYNITQPSTFTSAGAQAANASYVPTLSSMQINYGPSGYFQVTSGSPSTLVNFAPYDNPKYPSAKTLFDIMNFSVNPNTITSTVTSSIINGVNTVQTSYTTGNTSSATVLYSGIASMRPTEYIDIQCDQLTYSQEVRDSMSQPTSRDILARIYLQDNNNGQYYAPPVYTTGNLVGTPNTTISTLALTTPTVSLPFPTTQPPPLLPSTFTTLVANPIAANLTTQGLKSEQKYLSIPGTAPLTIYRQFQTPKYIKWGGQQNIPGYFRITLYDDRGNILSANGNSSSAPYFVDTNQPEWQFTALASEN